MSKFIGKQGFFEILMITLGSSPKQHLPKDMQHSVCARHMNINHFEMKKNIYEYTNLIDIYLHLLLLFCQLSVLTEVLFL